MAQPKNVDHGNRCSCRLLAEAVGCSPKTVRYAYCHAVLMRRWIVECNHGCCDEVVITERDDKWHDLGPIDPVKAILIMNE